jgi:hypothetical protein
VNGGYTLTLLARLLSMPAPSYQTLTSPQPP